MTRSTVWQRALVESAFLLAVVAFGALRAPAADAANETQAVGVPGSTASFEKMDEETEKLWPGQPVDYFQAKAQLWSALEPIAPTNHLAALEMEKSGRLALEKPGPADPAARLASLKQKSFLVGGFAKADYLNSDVEIARLLAKTLGEAQSSVITNYQRVRIASRGLPSPPIIPTNPPQGMNSSMDVDSIIDPVAREAWKKEIQKQKAQNELGRAQNSLQQELPRVVLEMKRSFFGYCQRWFKEDPDALKYRSELAAAASLSPAEVGRLGE